MSVTFWVALGLAAGQIANPPTALPDATVASQQLDAAVTTSWAGSPDIRPSARCDDATFLRRVWLDVAGRVPPFADADKLATAETPLDRAAVLDGLLSSSHFATYWSLMWSEYLLAQRPFDTPEYSGRKLQQFWREAFTKNRPYDQIVSDLICAEGATDESGAVNFLLRYNADPGPLAGAVSQKLLGLTLQCAECHDHPHAAWKQTDFCGLTAFFARIRRMNATNPQPNEQFSAVLERPRGELLVVDKKGKPDDQGNYPTRTIIPQFPGTSRREMAPARRAALVAWMTSPENPSFARHCVNQVWQRLMGASLATSFDPLPEQEPNQTPAARQHNSAEAKASSAILECLRSDFVASGFDLRRLITVIILSETYQRSASPLIMSAAGSPATDENGTLSPEQQRQFRQQEEIYAQARARPLSSDQVHLSLGQAFGFYYDENDRRLAQLTHEEFTYDVPLNSFGSEPRSLGRSLALFNGDHSRTTVDVAAQSLLRIHGESAGPAHIERLFLCLLSRPPTADELDAFLDLAGADIPQRGLEDATWVLLNSAEFLTNH